jgi:hypothetical protein
MEPFDPFDPERLRLNGSSCRGNQTPRPAKPPRHRPGEWFLRGPIPWTWLEAAARLRGKALALGLVLWREAGRRGGRRTVKLCLSRAGLGLNESAARRALRSLEAAGLVRIDRQPGHGLFVTILDAPVADGEGRMP